MVQCVTNEQWDGCIIKSQTNGAIGFIDNGTTLETYRLSENEYTAVFTTPTFTTNQGTTHGITDLTNTKVVTNDPTVAQEYMDYAKCTTVSGTGRTTSCHLWQPDWRLNDDGTNPVTDGYPRIGTEEEGTLVAYMDASATSAITWDLYSFKEARTLVAMGCALLTAYAF